MKIKECCTVESQECIAKGIYCMWISTKVFAKEAKAGQFISLFSKDGSRLLPRPISLCEIDREGGRLRIVYRVAGAGTEEFSHLKAGDEVDILGPLGNPRSRKDFQLLLQRLAREDYTILISSHILSELADLCTSIGVINGGVMVQQGKLENIMLAIDSSNPLRITVLNQVPKALELLRQDPQVSRLSVDENKIAAWFSGSREEEAYLLQKLVDAGILVVSFAREHNSLESLFFHLTGEMEQKSRNTETFGNTIG